MQEDGRMDSGDAATAAAVDEAEEHAAMLRLLNERMQSQWGQGQAIVHTNTSAEDTTELNDSPQAQEAINTGEPEFFRLFGSRSYTTQANTAESRDILPRVRLQSPSSLTLLHGRSLKRILAVEDEAKAIVKERRRNIKSAAVDAKWILETSTAHHWSARPQPPRKLLHKALLQPSHHRTPLPSVAIAYYPSPNSARKSAKVRADVEANGKVKLKTYPDLGKERVEDRIARVAKKRAASLAKDAPKQTVPRKAPKVEPAKKSIRMKRKSKKRRMHESAEETKT